MTTSASVSVGHGPGTPRNEGTAKDRGTPVPDSNLTEIDPTEERDRKSDPAKTASEQDSDKLLPGAKRGPAQPR